MTQEMKEVLDKEVEDAMESQDEARLRRCMARYIMAIGDCQYKTSARVKSVKTTVEGVQEDVGHIKDEMGPMKESHLLYRAEREQRKGVVWAIRLMWLLLCAAAAVGAFILGRYW